MADSVSTSDHSRRGFRRRSILAGGAALAAAGASGAARTAVTTGAATSETLSKSKVILREGTNIAVVPSPDGKRIAFDLLGVLWLVGIEGGEAVRLTDDYGDIARPDWSPDGKTLVFQSYRDGNFHLWTIGSDGRGLRQLTQGPFDHREPRYSSDGRQIACSSDRAGRYAIHILDLATGNIRQLSQGAAEHAEPAWSLDGKTIAYVADSARIETIALAGGEARTIAHIDPPKFRDHFRIGELHAPRFSPDGELVYHAVDDLSVRLIKNGATIASDEDLFPLGVGWLPDGSMIHAGGGRIWRRNPDGTTRAIEFAALVEVATAGYRKKRRELPAEGVSRPVIGIAAPQLSPDGRRIVFTALNDLWIMTIGQRPIRLSQDSFHVCDPTWSPDGRSIAYSTDRGGILSLWIRDLESGRDRQLTHLDHAAVSASWSPDGQRIAFLDQNGALHEIEIATSAVRKLAGPLWEPGRPSWAADGKTIALAAVKPYSARFREGLNEVLTVDRATGATRYASVLPDRSIATRGYDGPAWSPDGRHLAFVFASTLWIVPVDGQGRSTGAPRQVSREVCDAPSWSGNSRQILYLSNGRLRLVDIEDGSIQAVPFELRWASPARRGATLIRAGRLWDGSTRGYRRDVDILIKNNRIAHVGPASPHVPTDPGVHFIDARNQVVLPGLTDMHTHPQMQGYNFGDRQGRLWLSMGITTVRSTGAPAYHMVEDREATASGKRVGPRHFGTGEAIDGSRIFYHFIRPLTEPGQLALELERAQALDYDLLKTYVRLPHDQQRLLIAEAHRRGVHLTSHYHWPALANGVDAMEHLGATSRLGYSRTHSATGAGYQDVHELFARAHAIRTPTFFFQHALLHEDPALVADRRLATLYPAWELNKFRARAAAVETSNRQPMLNALERNVAQILETMRAGWHILAGTDAPIDFVAVSLHLHLRALVKFGVSTHDALLAATAHAGDFLNEPFGRVAVGQFADLIIVDGDPLANIKDVAAVKYVVANGAVHDVDGLLSPFAGLSHDHAAHNPVLPALASASQPWWHDPVWVEASRNACCQGSAHQHSTAHCATAST